MSSERPYRCGLYLPGHDSHWIQVKLAGRNEPDPKTGEERAPIPVRVVDVASDGFITIEGDFGLKQLWNHDPGRTVEVATEYSEVGYQPAFNLLRFVTEWGFKPACVAELDSPKLQPCPELPPTGDPLSLLQTAGGFTISGTDALRWADSLERDS